MYFYFSANIILLNFWCKCGNCNVASLKNINECYCCCEVEGRKESIKSDLVLQNLALMLTWPVSLNPQDNNPFFLKKWSLRLDKGLYINISLLKRQDRDSVLVKYLIILLPRLVRGCFSLLHVAQYEMSRKRNCLALNTELIELLGPSTTCSFQQNHLAWKSLRISRNSSLAPIEHSVPQNLSISSFVSSPLDTHRRKTVSYGVLFHSLSFSRYYNITSNNTSVRHTCDQYRSNLPNITSELCEIARNTDCWVL